jgi:antitoxin YefM
MNTISVTEARKKLFSLVDLATESHEPIHITSKKGGAILISEEDWSSIQETLYLLSIPGMRESIIKGIKTPLKKLDTELKW